MQKGLQLTGVISIRQMVGAGIAGFSLDVTPVEPLTRRFHGVLLVAGMGSIYLGRWGVLASLTVLPFRLQLRVKLNCCAVVCGE